MPKRMNIEYKENISIEIADLMTLYTDAGWKNYTDDPGRLKRAYDNSRYAASAWDGRKLVGIIRMVGDGEAIAYIQDILVLESHRRMGIGSRLLDMALEKCKDIRQKALLTDQTDETIAFYLSNGFKKSTDLGMLSFVRFDKV